MPISFEKHRLHIVAAWKDVLDDKSSTNWALFGYEGQTNELKVVGSGVGGVEELCDDLNSGKIMYAFVRIEDPTSALNKYLLINWQGEGAPVLRKGTCANHIHAVSKLLSGAHLTINARNEDDIDLERLLNKLSTVSSAYSFKEPRNVQENVQQTSVGTNYARVIPTKELNSSVMQDFWKQEEAEEKRRIATEKETKRLDLLKLEQEQRMREEKEHQEREKKVSNANLQPAHIPIKTSPQPLSPEKTAANFNTCTTEAERMRQQRNQEARELIGSRVGVAKAIFTRNTSEGQLQTKLNTAPPAKPARTSIAQRINAFNQTPTAAQQATPAPKPTAAAKVEQAPIEMKVKTSAKAPIETATPAIVTAAVPDKKLTQEPPVTAEITAVANNDDIHTMVDDYIIDTDEQYSTIKRSPHTKSNSLQSPDENTLSNATDNAVSQDQDGYADEEEEEVRTKVSITVQQPQSAKNGTLSSFERNELTDIVNEDDFICHDALDDAGLKARALYDYQAADETEITFDPGDVITHIDQIDEGWWQGLGPDGTYGLFPANYVEIIN